jgi:hypothetical protein
MTIILSPPMLSRRAGKEMRALPARMLMHQLAMSLSYLEAS